MSQVIPAPEVLCVETEVTKYELNTITTVGFIRQHLMDELTDMGYTPFSIRMVQNEHFFSTKFMMYGVLNAS